MLKKNKLMYSLVTLLIVLGLVLSGCTQQAAPADAPAPAGDVQQDTAQILKTAVADYFKDLPTVGDNYKISEDKLKEELEKNPDKYVVFDIRKADAYAAGHIKGAINVPFGKDIADNLDKIRAAANGKTAIVACYTGQTAGQTDAVLNIAGIKTRSLNFGMGNGLEGKGWLGKKYPTVTEPTEMPNAPAVDDSNPAISKAVKDYFTNMPEDVHKIGTEEFQKGYSENPDKYFVVSIRQEKDYNAGHIPGAVNVPWGPAIADNIDMIKEKADGKTLVVYCYSGQTAGQTVGALNLLGIDAHSLNFGFGVPGLAKSWSQMGFEVEK